MPRRRRISDLEEEVYLLRKVAFAASRAALAVQVVGASPRENAGFEARAKTLRELLTEVGFDGPRSYAAEETS